jgi:hypothetical protein
MSTATLVGSLVLALSAVLVAWFVLWRRNRAVFWFAVALIIMGTGYLIVTGAANDIGRRFVVHSSSPPTIHTT